MMRLVCAEQKQSTDSVSLPPESRVSRLVSVAEFPRFCPQIYAELYCLAGVWQSNTTSVVKVYK